MYTLFRSLHIGFVLFNILNLICREKYKKYVESIFLQSYLIEVKKEPKLKPYTLSQMYTMVLI